MEKIILAIAYTLFSLGVIAQTASDEGELIHSMYGVDKKELVTDAMKLNEQESVVFWPIYDKYEIARKELGKIRMSNLDAYSKNYKSLTEEKATEIVNTALSNQKAMTNLQQSTFEEMSKAITSVRAALFIQFEQFLEADIRGEIANKMPFIPQAKKK